MFYVGAKEHADTDGETLTEIDQVGKLHRLMESQKSFSLPKCATRFHLQLTKAQFYKTFTLVAYSFNRVGYFAEYTHMWLAVLGP